MITVRNSTFIAEGEKEPFMGRNGEVLVYTVKWNVWGIASEGENGEAIEKDDILVGGYVKWDGCSNWSFHTEACMHHACSRSMLLEIGDILAKCWDASEKLMPEKWQG